MIACPIPVPPTITSSRASPEMESIAQPAQNDVIAIAAVDGPVCACRSRRWCRAGAGGDIDRGRRTGGPILNESYFVFPAPRLISIQVMLVLAG